MFEAHVEGLVEAGVGLRAVQNGLKAGFRTWLSVKKVQEGFFSEMGNVTKEQDSAEEVYHERPA